MKKQIVRIAGLIATHREHPFYGVIEINSHSGLITRVERGMHEGPFDYDFTKERGVIIFAGFIDVHIHAREDETGKQCYKEDYLSAASAALRGGVVCCMAMPNTPNPVTTKERFAWHRSRIKQIQDPVVILNYVGVDASTRPLGRLGEYPYKVYFGKSVGDLTVMYGSELDRILARYRRQHVSFHVEYEPVVQNAHQGRTHSERRPVECVNEGLRLLLPLIEKYEIRAKLCHWSTGGESFELIDAYRKRGCDITLEVSPLHLLFDTSMTDADPGLWMKVQMNPAIQSPVHRRALIEGLRSGFIQMIATDHAPHTEDEKYAAFSSYRESYPGLSPKQIAESMRDERAQLYDATAVLNNTSGAPWLDVYALTCLWLMHEHGFSARDIARVAAYQPGVFANQFLQKQYPRVPFGRGFGDIRQGYLGSLTVLRTVGSTTVERSWLKTKVGWSPLEGREMPGQLVGVFIRGSYYGRGLRCE